MNNLLLLYGFNFFREFLNKLIRIIELNLFGPPVDLLNIFVDTIDFKVVFAFERGEGYFEMFYLLSQFL